MALSHPTHQRVTLTVSPQGQYNRLRGKMFLEYKIIVETPIMPSLEPISNGQVIIPASILKGFTRLNFHRFLNMDEAEGEKVFGNKENPEQIIFEDVIYHGETHLTTGINLGAEGEVDRDSLHTYGSIPVGAELRGKLHIAPDITMRQINVIRHSLYLLGITGIGGMRSRGYGKCVMEFPDLKEAGMVFLSYTWEDEVHNEWVLSLADNLVQSGIVVIFDRYDLGIGDNFQVFMEHGVAKANKVLLIFTPQYKEKALARKGGAGYEYSLVNAELLETLANNNKFLPILRKGDVNSSIPPIYKQYIYCDMRDDSKFDQNFKDLYFAILGKKQVTRPASPWH
jgi:hypothetical protein